MQLTLKSKIRDAWRSPTGHDMLQALMKHIGRDLNWPAGAYAGRMALRSLDRIAGKGFAQALVDQVNKAQEMPAVQPAPEERKWWKEAVVYQIYLPSFMDSDHDGMGDLGGVAQRLPYLERLGVNVLWIWPLLDTPSIGERGIRDFEKVTEEFGGIDAFETLLDAAHARGMKVVMGLDIASTSDQHSWFTTALEEPESGLRDHYVFRRGTAETPPNHWGRLAAGPAWNWYPEIEAWALRLLGKHRMDLNWDNPAVRGAVQRVLRFWLDKGVDGFCLSSVGLISKESYAEGNPAVAAITGLRGAEQFTYGPAVHRYLRELRREGVGNTDALLLGEARSVGTETAKLLTGAEREELDMVLDNGPLLAGGKKHGEESVYSLRDLRSHFLNWMNNYGGDYWMPLFVENAELPRMVSRVGASPVYRGILAKLLGTLLLTLRGTPVIYQGQELGLANTRFASMAELRSAVSQRMYTELCEQQGEQSAFQKVLSHAPDHARTPMPWNTGRAGGFTGAEPWMRLPDGVEYLNVMVQMADTNSVLHHYQQLIELRRENPCLVYGSFNPVFLNNKNVLCYFRMLDGEKWYVELNLTEREVSRPGRILPAQRLRLSNYDTQARTLRPYEANLYQCS